MREKSTKVDRIGIEDIGIDHYSDYSGSPESLNDVNVREALRTTISQKSTLPNQEVKLNIPSVSIDKSEAYSEDDLDAELDLVPKKIKKSKAEDEESAAVRRERNRLAAQRCRQRRRDRIEKLEKICQRLENDGDKLQLEITGLQKEMNNLQRVLENHSCVSRPIKTEIFMPSQKKEGYC